MIVASVVLVCVPTLASAEPTPADITARALAPYIETGSLQREQAHRAEQPQRSELGRAFKMVQRGQHQAALQLIDPLSKQLPQLADLLTYLRGNALLGVKRYRAAVKAFRANLAIKHSRWFDASREGLARALLGAKQPKKAAGVIERLLRGYQDHPHRARLRVLLGRCLVAHKTRRARKSGVATLQAVYVEHPATDEARSAAAELAKLRKAGVKVPALTHEMRLSRARRLRRIKRLDQAIAELKALRAVASPLLRDRVDLSLAYTYRVAQRPEAALSLLAPLYQRAKKLSKRGQLPWGILRRYTTMLTWSGKVDKAVEALLDGVPKRLTRRSIWRYKARLAYAVELWSQSGRYAQAHAAMERLAGAIGRYSYPRTRAWLAYRAGHFDLAIKRWQRLDKRRRRPSAFSMYWQARAHQKAGRDKQAVALYRQVLERHLRNYYGHLARSRLVEMRELALEHTRCEAPSQRTPRDVGSRLAALAKRHADVLPDLDRAAILWRAGLHDQARRELRNIALDLTWVLYRGRYHAYRIRSWIARLWRGRGPNPKRWRLDKHQKRLAAFDRADRRALLHELGPVFTDAGLGYYGWRFSPPAKNNMKRYYPRAFQRLVTRMARRYALDANLMWAIMRTESGYRPDAISPVYAGGLMQVMPYTATRLASELQLDNFDLVHVYRPRTNVELSAHYLRAVSSKFQGQVPLVAAAYNGGPHNVARWLAQRGKSSAMDEFVEEIPFRESKLYAKKVVRLIAAYERSYCNKDDRVVPNALDSRFSNYPSY